MSLLSSTYKNFIKQWPEHGNGRPIADVFGTYCYSFNDCVLVAKSYAWSGVVSCHRRAFDHCLKHDKPLIMFLASPKGWFKFAINGVKGAYENDRRGVPMMNFKLEYGVRLAELSTLQSLQTAQKLL